MSLDLRHVDYAARLEAWREQQGRFYEIDRNFVHKRFLQMTTAGGDIPEALSDHILRQMLTYFYATAANDAQFEAEKVCIMEMWPAAAERMRHDPGLAQLMLEHGSPSRYVFPFLHDIWFQPGVSFLPGFGLARTVNDRIEPLPFSDQLVVYTPDCTFGMENYRTSVFQPHVKQAHRVLLLGGGLAPVLWSRLYPLGELDQEIIIYDNNPKMPQYLEQLIERPLKGVGIDYRVADVQEAFNDPGLQHWADFLDVAGLAAYFDTQAESFYGGLGRLVAPNGMVGFDYTLFDPTFLFVLKTCHWQTPFAVEKSVEDARAKAVQYAAYGSLRIVDTQVGPAKHPVSVTFLAQPK